MVGTPHPESTFLLSLHVLYVQCLGGIQEGLLIWWSLFCLGFSLGPFVVFSLKIWCSRDPTPTPASGWILAPTFDWDKPGDSRAYSQAIAVTPKSRVPSIWDTACKIRAWASYLCMPRESKGWIHNSSFRLLKKFIPAFSSPLFSPPLPFLSLIPFSISPVSLHSSSAFLYLISQENEALLGIDSPSPCSFLHVNTIFLIVFVCVCVLLCGR